MLAVSIFGGLLSVLIPILVIGAVIYIIVRRREGKSLFTAYQALITYFYIVIAASVITMATGIAYLIFAGLTQAFDGQEIADDITLGFTLLGTGLIICIPHLYGKRTVEKKDEKATATLRRVYLFFMLGVSGIAGFVSLPLAINSTVRHYVEESIHRPDPSQYLATAIVVVPLWGYYLIRVLRDMRGGTEGEDSPDKQAA